MRRRLPLLIAVTSAAALAIAPAWGASGGRTAPSLKFFTGGAGAHADWLATRDQPETDTDPQAIRIVTTTDPNGYAGIYVQHVEGQPTATFPNSSYAVKTTNYTGPSLGTPRLVIQFSDGGYAELRPSTLSENWQTVTDPNWDDHGGAGLGCGFQYETTWEKVQACHPATVVTAAYLTTDPYGWEYRIDDLTVDGTNFTRAADNGDTSG